MFLKKLTIIYLSIYLFLLGLTINFLTKNLSLCMKRNRLSNKFALNLSVITERMLKKFTSNETKFIHLLLLLQEKK